MSPAKQQRRKGVGYIRVSRVNGRAGDSFISPELQRETIEGIAKASGIRIVAWYEDLDQSGKKWDRPGFQSALSDVEEKRASVIVVARMSRFARSVIDAEKALERIEGAGGALVAADMNVDATTPNGRLMRGLMQLIAQWELEVLSEQWKAAKMNALDRGVKLSRKPPPGYKRNGEKRLVIDEKVAPAVVEVFEARARGASWTELVKLWKERTGCQVTRQAIAHMVSNRTYLGEVRYGDLIAPKDKWHEPIVDEKQFAAAQSKETRRAFKRNGSLLAGVLTCGTCGGAMTSGSAGKGKGSRYRCNRSTAKGFCASPMSVNAELADPVVEKRFLAWAAEQKRPEGIAAADELEAAVAEQEKAEAELEAFVRATSASANLDLFVDALAEREYAVEAARDRVDELRASGHVETVRTSAVELWPSLDLAERRRLLGAAIEKCELHAPADRSARGVPFEERVELVFRDR
jgi:DNA invertase Pin-like site-specific DNA recombinase